MLSEGFLWTRCCMKYQGHCVCARVCLSHVPARATVRVMYQEIKFKETWRVNRFLGRKTLQHFKAIYCLSPWLESRLCLSCSPFLFPVPCTKVRHSPYICWIHGFKKSWMDWGWWGWGVWKGGWKERGREGQEEERLRVLSKLRKWSTRGGGECGEKSEHSGLLILCLGRSS